MKIKHFVVDGCKFSSSENLTSISVYEPEYPQKLKKLIVKGKSNLQQGESLFLDLESSLLELNKFSVGFAPKSGIELVPVSSNIIENPPLRVIQVLWAVFLVLAFVLLTAQSLSTGTLQLTLLFFVLSVAFTYKRTKYLSKRKRLTSYAYSLADL